MKIVCKHFEIFFLECEEYGTYVSTPTDLLNSFIEFDTVSCDALAPTLLDDGTFAKRKEFPHMVI